MKHTPKEWFFATRPWGYPASLIPALIIISYVFYAYNMQQITDVNWWFGALAALGAAIYQASGNVISDYFDYKYGVDRNDSYGNARSLVDKHFTPKEILFLGLSLLTVGILIGVFYLIAGVSLNLLWIGLLGILGTVFYYVLKYRALGDLNIFIIYGELISLGTYLVMTDTLSWKVLLIAASTGFLIVNILHANNMRDIKQDSRANIKTQAMVLGIKKSIWQYAILGYGAYLLIVICVILGILPWLTLFVFVTLPIQIKNIKEIKTAEIEDPSKIKTMDEKTAQHLTMFGAIVIIANIIAGLLA